MVPRWGGSVTAPLRRLYYVVGYDRPANQWWRFVLTAENSDAAVQVVEAEYDRLSRVGAEYICHTPDHIFQEL